MKLSTRSRYGLRLMFQLALNHDSGSLQLSEIAKREDISEKYLSQIVIILKNHGLIGAVRGSQGGYFLVDQPEKVSLKEVITALEGSLDPVDCVDNKDCSRTSICVTRKVWQILAKAIKDTLGKYTLADLVAWHKKSSGGLAFDI